MKKNTNNIVQNNTKIKLNKFEDNYNITIDKH